MDMDPGRIGRILNMLKVYWHAHPELRLGQMLFNLQLHPGDLYYAEDSEIEQALREQLKKQT